MGFVTGMMGFFVIVQEIKKRYGIIIETADGSLIKQNFHSNAVCIQSPPNWRELLTSQRARLDFYQSAARIIQIKGNLTSWNVLC
jgi:hypothetical protein